MAVRSEIDPIRQVLIHTPGSEHNYTLPKNTTEWVADESGQLIHNPDYLLFDDIISPSGMAAEHNELENVLTAFTGKDHTYQFNDILVDTLQTPAQRQELYSACSTLDQKLYGMEILWTPRKFWTWKRLILQPYSCLAASRIQSWKPCSSGPCLT